MSIILVVEDNQKLAENMRDGLGENGYEVHCCTQAHEARSWIEKNAFDLVVLDLGLPDEEGLDLVPEFKAKNPECAILILTARDSVEDRVKGLESGGDDYLVKPFAFVELKARIRALGRRSGPSREVLHIADTIKIDLRRRRITSDDVDIDLSPKEFDLLVFLAENRGQVVSRDMLAREVWQVTSRAISMNNVIDVHISRIREKLEHAGKGGILKTIRGLGFQLDA